MYIQVWVGFKPGSFSVAAKCTNHYTMQQSHSELPVMDYFRRHSHARACRGLLSSEEADAKTCGGVILDYVALFSSQ
jgi:hypothetical protein